MTAVKGSKQYKMKVVPYRPVYRALAWTGATLLVLAAIVSAYYGGRYQGTLIQAEAIAERDQLLVAIEEARREADQLRQQVVNLELGAEVDRQAGVEVRHEVISLRNQITELQEDIAFYRGLMAPTDNKRGLTIGSLNVIATGAPREYQYKLVVQQLATNHQLLTGHLNFDVVGRRSGAAGQPSSRLTLPLKDLSEKVVATNIKLRFKYFQNFEGRITLPEGFEPERIELLAKSTGKNPVTVEKKFGWLVQEG